jgi:hypothetical protein
MLLKNRGEIYFLIYINIQEFNIWKIDNLKVYMHARIKGYFKFHINNLKLLNY